MPTASLILDALRLEVRAIRASGATEGDIAAALKALLVEAKCREDARRIMAEIDAERPQ